MQDVIYEEIETGRDGISLKLEFPQSYENEKTIRDEVKQILSALLWEHLDKMRM